MAFRYHLILFSVFIYSSIVVIDGWHKSELEFWTSLIYFCTYISVYGVELVKYLSSNERP